MTSIDGANGRGKFTSHTLLLPVLCVILLATMALAGCLLPKEKYPWEGMTTGAQNQSVCASLSSPGSYILNKSLVSNTTCITINAENVTFDCNGFSITGNGSAATYGIYGQTGVKNVTIKNFIIKNYSSGIYFNTVLRINITNVSVNASAVSGVQPGINLAATSNVYIGNSIITGVTNGILAQTSGCANITIANSIITGGAATNAYPVNQQATCPNMTLINNTITANPGYTESGVFMMASGNTLIANAITGANAAAVYFYTISSNNWVENNTLIGVVGTNGAALVINSASNNSTIIGNNLTGNGTSKPVILVDGYNNTFILNSFITTNSSGVFLQDTSGGNFYKSTYAGKNQGNIWNNVINRSVVINSTGTMSSIPTFFIGTGGAGYPYNNSTSVGKFLCSFAGCGDYAPLVNLTGNLTVNSTTGGTAIGNNTSFVPPANLTINVSISASYYLINWTSNCNGTILNITNPNTTIQINDLISCFAQANMGQYGSLTVNYSAGGTAVGNNTIFVPPAVLPINATANATSYFVNWTTNCSTMCYQETANLSTTCGGVATGKYASVAGSATDSGFYTNYTKPSLGQNTSVWQVKRGSLAAVNFSIPSDCWSYNNTTLMFKVGSNMNIVAANDNSTVYCYNGTWKTIGATIFGSNVSTAVNTESTTWYDGDWNTFSTAMSFTPFYVSSVVSGVSNASLFEEAMWWNMSSAIVNATNPNTNIIVPDMNTCYAQANFGKYAVFTVNYTSGGNATGSNSTFLPPAVFSINATPNATSYFTNWTTNCTSAQATGGSITYDGLYVIHTFTSNGTFNVTGAINATVLVVAGGGSGGVDYNYHRSAGGGGAGGLIYNTSYNATGNITVVVGIGGASVAYSNSPVAGNNGQNSSFGTLTAIGGGGGAGSNGGGQVAGTTGGSGGGCANGGCIGKNGTAGQGNKGGNGLGTDVSPYTDCAGGGGAGTAGATAPANATGGAAGNGTAYSINGTSVYYAGGGACQGYGGVNGTAGLGGGGLPQTAGTNGTGGGGGGASGVASGAGGSGIVIIRYLLPSIANATNPNTIIGVFDNACYAQANFKAYNVFAVTPATGCPVVTFKCFAPYMNDTQPNCQNMLTPAFNVSNPSALNYTNVTMRVNGNIASGFSVYACTSPYRNPSCINVSNSFQTIIRKLNVNQSKGVWQFGDCNNVSNNQSMNFTYVFGGG